MWFERPIDILQNMSCSNFKKRRTIDEQIQTWRQRDLSDRRFPFLIADAMVIDVRRDMAVRSTSVLVVYGINEWGCREPLDCLIADSENEASWQELFANLKQRGLKGVDLVVSDAHQGLVKALKQQFQGVRWQRCQTHLMRNILNKTPSHCREAVSDRLKLIFQAEDKKTARQLAHQLIDEFETKASKAMTILDDGLEDALAVLELPKRYRKRLRTNNLAERVNTELRRRERVVQVFPNEQAADRLMISLLYEIYEAWQFSSKRYFDMTEYWDWVQDQQDDEPIKTEKNSLRA